MYGIKDSWKHIYGKSFDSLYGYVKYWSTKQPTRIAFQSNSSTQESLTYQALYNQVTLIRNQFRALGIQSNERVGILIANKENFAIASIALSEGAVCVPLSSQLPQEEFIRTIRLFQLTVLVTDLDQYHLDALLAKELSLEIIRIKNEHDKPIGFFSFTNPPQKALETVSWRASSEQSFSFIFQTTGTTAKPKLVPIKMKSIVAASDAMVKFLNITQEDRCLNFLPLNFVHGLVTCLYVPLIAGSTIKFMDSFERTKFVEEMLEFKPTWFSATPAIYNDLLKLNQAQQDEISTNVLRFIRIGSSPLSKAVFEKIEKLFKAPLIEAYGMTETLLIACNPIRKRNYGSVGVPVGASVKIINEKNKICRKNEQGIIWVKGKSVSNFYLDNQEATKEAFRDGWFNTGDIGFIDSKGYLFLSGRNKVIINKGGQKISPFEVEDVLLKFPIVEEAVVFSVPHEVLGEDCMAVVICAEGEVLDEYKIKEFLSGLLTAYKIPSKIIQVNEIERTENGKVKRKNLADYFLPKIQESLFSGQPLESLTPAELFVSNHISRVLDIATPNVQQDFFSMGGTSIDLVSLLAGMNKDLGVEIDGIEFMNAPDIKSFGKYIQDYFSANIPADFLASGWQVDRPVAISNGNGSVINDEEVIRSNKLHYQRLLVIHWEGIRLNKDSLVVGKNVEGKKKPIFWCFQSYKEFEALAIELGPEQPLYGMRSGHLVIGINEIQHSKFPEVYANEMMQLFPKGDFVLGGNCQGGRVAWYVAEKLRSNNREVELLVMMESSPLDEYPGRIAMLFGNNSTLQNPYLTKENPDEDWKRMLRDYSVDFLTSKHGQYFEKENISELVGFIERKLSEMAKR